MSIVPEFEIGLWNAWIFMVPALSIILLTFPMMMRKDAPGSARRAKRVPRIPLVFASLSKLLFIPAGIYSVFLPLQPGTSLFYVGLPITIVGLFVGLMVWAGWVNTPAGEPVTTGIYRYSRHPMYLAMVLVLLGVSLIAVSWVFSLLTIITAIGVTRPYFVRIEEAECLRHYGDAYREYMKRTPRWIGIPKRKNRD